MAAGAQAQGRFARWSLVALSAGAVLCGGVRRQPGRGGEGGAVVAGAVVAGASAEVETEVEAWAGYRAESTLTKKAFACAGGQVFGIQLPRPQAAGTSGKFFYVQLNPLPDFYPVQVYLDKADQCNIFLVVPPDDGAGDRQWHLLYRRSDRPQGEVWVEQRLFGLGSEHPCGPDGDLEAKAVAAATEDRDETKDTAATSKGSPPGGVGAEAASQGDAERAGAEEDGEHPAEEAAAATDAEAARAVVAEAATVAVIEEATTTAAVAADLAVEATPRPAAPVAAPAQAEAPARGGAGAAQEAPAGVAEPAAAPPAGVQDGRPATPPFEQEGIFLRAFRAFRAWQRE